VTKPQFLSKDGHRIERAHFTDGRGQTHCGIAEWKLPRLQKGEELDRACACTRYYDGKHLDADPPLHPHDRRTTITPIRRPHQVSFMIDG